MELPSSMKRVFFWLELDKNKYCIVGCTNIDRQPHDLYIRTLPVYVERGPEAARHIRGGKKATLVQHSGPA